MTHDNRDHEDHSYADDRKLDRREAEFRANPPTYDLAERIALLPEAEDRLAKATAHLDGIRADNAVLPLLNGQLDAAMMAQKEAKRLLLVLKAQIQYLAKKDSAGGRSRITFD